MLLYVYIFCMLSFFCVVLKPVVHPGGGGRGSKVELYKCKSSPVLVREAGMPCDAIVCLLVAFRFFFLFSFCFVFLSGGGRRSTSWKMPPLNQIRINKKLYCVRAYATSTPLAPAPPPYPFSHGHS